LKDQLQQRLNAVSSGVQQTIVDETPTNGDDSSGLVAIMAAACLLTFSRWTAQHFMIYFNILLR